MAPSGAVIAVAGLPVSSVERRGLGPVVYSPFRMFWLYHSRHYDPVPDDPTELRWPCGLLS